MIELFSEHRTLIVFLHVISAVVWVGGMIAMRFAAHYSFQALEPEARLRRTADALGRLFAIVSPFVLMLLATALIMAIGLGLHHSDVRAFAFAKEGIWSLMALNLLAMMLRRRAALKRLNANDLGGAKAQLEPVGRFMVPVNIALGVVAIYLGASLSGVY